MSEEYPDFGVDEMLALWAEGKWDDCRKRKQVMWCDMHGWDYADEGDWTQDCKYQQCTNIIQHLASGRCFEVSASRSGSYHTDWHYNFDSEPAEVQKTVVMEPVERWVCI